MVTYSLSDGGQGFTLPMKKVNDFKINCVTISGDIKTQLENYNYWIK